MTEKFDKAFGRSRAFHEINQEIIKWDYSELSGEGFYNVFHRPKYGHLLIKISKGNEHLGHIEWAENLQIPLEFRDAIKNVFKFLNSYIEGLKGEEISLNFSVIDGSFHPVDSSELSFEIATIYAIKSCFLKPVKEITDSDRKLIERFKKYNSE